MNKMSLLGLIDPFPDPTHAGQEIEFIGLMFASILIVVMLLIVMIYLFAKKRFFLPILVVFLFSIVIGMISIENSTIPFSPWFQIFFILVQAMFFLLTVLELRD